MKTSFQMLLGAAAIAAAFAPVSAGAQASCPEGRLPGGQCVNPALADTMRQLSIVFAQPKISETAFPILPSGDSIFRYPNSLIPDPLKPSSSGVGATPPPPPTP